MTPARNVLPPPASLHRHLCVLGLVLASLGGCANAPSIQASFDTLRTAWAGAPDVPLTRAQVNELPYASVRMRFGKGPRSFLVLGQYAGEELHWYSADRGLVATRGGRVVRTVGFPQDLRDTRRFEEDPLRTGLHHLSGPASHRRLLDLHASELYALPVQCEVRPDGEEEIEILEYRYPALHFREHCTAEGVRWRFENRYWVDRFNGTVWKSVQHFAPDLPPLQIELLKPAA